MSIDSFVISRKIDSFSIKHSYNKVIKLQSHPIQTRLVHQILKVPKNCRNIIFINRLRSSLALTIFAPAIQGINKLDINTINTRSATYNLLKL